MKSNLSCSLGTTSTHTRSFMDQSKVTLQQISSSLHTVHGILEDILGRIFNDRIDQQSNFDGNDGLKSLASEAHNLVKSS
jgi:hypothetical protein